MTTSLTTERKWLVAHARPCRLRSIRDFAEQEIVIPRRTGLRVKLLVTPSFLGPESGFAVPLDQFPILVSRKGERRPATRRPGQVLGARQRSMGSTGSRGA